MSEILFALLLIQANSPVLENDYVSVHRDYAPCASRAPECGERVLVALGRTTFEGAEMERGDVRVFGAEESYTSPQRGSFVEVVLKPDRPAARTTTETIVPENYNVIRYENDRFRVIEGRLRPGDSRTRHTHDQRLIIYLNSTRLYQQPDGQPAQFIDLIADDIGFSEPTIHAIENVGGESVRNIVIELKPE